MGRARRPASRGRRHGVLERPLALGRRAPRARCRGAPQARCSLALQERCRRALSPRCRRTPSAGCLRGRPAVLGGILGLSPFGPGPTSRSSSCLQGTPGARPPRALGPRPWAPRAHAPSVAPWRRASEMRGQPPPCRGRLPGDGSRRQQKMRKETRGPGDGPPPPWSPARREIPDRRPQGTCPLPGASHGRSGAALENSRRGPFVALRLPADPPSSHVLRWGS